MNNLSTLQTIAVMILPLLFGITVHEVAHGWMASKLGDKTALLMGRLTLNPIKHIDPVGTIIVPGVLVLLGGVIFGWAKPVPVTYANLKKPKRDMALVAAAGPLSNLLMAFIWAFIMKLSVVLFQHGLHWMLAIVYMGEAGILINLMLMTLNLIPIPPLDGSRIVSGFLPARAAYKYNKLEPYGFFILLLLLATRVLTMIIMPVTILFLKLISAIFALGV
ncbi:MAG: site-2 protease family protein [Gammaproteobacteria bacterium]|nr:site-2 protease family protein [Gammaproteobacteria bacterium]